MSGNTVLKGALYSYGEEVLITSERYLLTVSCD